MTDMAIPGLNIQVL